MPAPKSVMLLESIFFGLSPRIVRVTDHRGKLSLLLGWRDARFGAPALDASLLIALSNWNRAYAALAPSSSEIASIYAVFPVGAAHYGLLCGVTFVTTDFLQHYVVLLHSSWC